MNQNKSLLKIEKKKFNPYKIFGIDEKSLIKQKIKINKKNFSGLNSPKKTIDLSHHFSKSLKKLALSNLEYKKYISDYDKITKENCFKTRENTTYPKRKNFQFIHLSYFSEKTPKKRPKSIMTTFNELNLNNYETFDKKSSNKYLYTDTDKNEIIDNTVKETSYGFKYKNTKIILNDKGGKKYNFYKNNIFNPSRNEENEYIIQNNNFFMNFTNGNFFENNYKKRFERNPYYEEFKSYDVKYKNDNKEYIIKKEKNILYLFEYIKRSLNDNNIYNNDIFKKNFEYNIKSQFKNKFTFLLQIKSIYLEFVEINPKDNFTYGNKHKIYFPFYYIPLFYLLDFISFKSFISEIIKYNINSNKFELDLDKEHKIFSKYIKNAEIYYNRQINIKENVNSKIFNEITFNLNENKFNINYDWFIYNKTNNNKEEENKIYKMKINFPCIKFNLKEKKIRIMKYINKYLMIELFKKNFLNWNKIILFNLFIQKKFRYIMNNILSNKLNIYLNKKIYLDEIYPNNKNNYEFFITKINPNKNKFFYFSPYSLILTYFSTIKDIKMRFIQLSIKDSNNINKLSQYLEIYNIIGRCISVEKDTKEIKLNMNLIDNISNDFIYIVKKENKIKNIEINKNYDEKEIYNYKINNIEMNIILRKPRIINIKNEKNEIILTYYKVPEILLNDILQNINKEHIKCAYNSLNEIINEIENFEENNFIDFNKEIINIKIGEILSRKNYGKMLYEINNNGVNSLFFGKFKKLKISKMTSKFIGHRNTKLFGINNIFDGKSKSTLIKFGNV